MTSNPRRPVPRCSSSQQGYASTNSRQQVRTVMQYDFNSMPLAMAYVPVQSWGDTFSYEEALRRGTVFAELCLPFNCAGGCNA